jgi:hypothetical protein
MLDSIDDSVKGPLGVRTGEMDFVFRFRLALEVIPVNPKSVTADKL